MAELLTIDVLVPWLLGMVFGVFVGSTPGLTATMAVALIVPFSYHLEPTAGLALIIGVSFTAIFAGDIPATFLRIPGTPASAAATLDGHEMAKQGQGGLALTLDLLCSCVGGLIGVALLMTVAAPMAKLALMFTNFEYFWLAMLGLGLSVLVSQGSAAKGALSAAFGMLLSTVGLDVITGAQRFTLHQTPWIEETNLPGELIGGVQFIPVMIGLFGLAEVLRNIGHPASGGEKVKGGYRPALFQAVWLMVKKFRILLQSAVAGTFVGALPGAGADIAAWAAYGLAQRTSREGHRFGTGNVEGVIAPTSANNAAVGGAWIPALFFGVPGDAVTAIVLNAFVTYDITPGPQILVQSGEQVRAIFMIALFTQVLLLPAGLIGILLFGQFMRLPRRFVLVAVVIFSIVGAYALRNTMLDVYVMFAFGLVGYFLERQRVPLAPLILGLILGPMVEKNLRVGLGKTGGDLTPFFTRPICLLLLSVLLLAFVVAPLAKRLMRRRNSWTSRG